MVRLLVLLLLWVVQAAFVILLVNAPWLEQQATHEQTRVEGHFGSARYERVAKRAVANYRSWFVESGIVAASYERLLPEPNRPQHGMEGLAPWFFGWLRHRLDAFWWLVYQAMHRAQLIREWSPILGTLIAAAGTDGLVQRQIKRCQHGRASSDRYTLARRALFLLGSAPALYLSLPVSVSPIAVPIWGSLLALCLLVFMASAQHEL